MSFRKLQIACSVVSSILALVLFAYWMFTPNLGFEYVVRMLLLVGFAAEPFLRLSWRFSLRTLLVAMTIVAVVFGLVAYAVK
jgi:hypothetical protein